jgi:hypothetical protein
MLLRISGSDVASRVRRPCQGYRDLTVRSRRESGHRTELDKLRDGHCDWYFYGWAEDGLIDEWMIVDMNKVRAEGLLDKERYEISNKDGTYFVAVSARELFDCGCIAAHELPDWCLP